ncbi:hypothetical protein D3C77_326330 [compost metagenome]
MSISQNAGMLTEAAENIYQCLRLAQLIANNRFVREKQAKEWFSSVLETLTGLGFKLVEHTKRTIPYTPTQDVLKDVFNGWLPAPQATNSRFKSAATEVINILQASQEELYRRYSSSTHLNITLDSDDGLTLVAILFHVLCTQDPNAPKTRLRLELDHLGAVFDKVAFTAHRDSVQAQLKVFADLDQILFET